MCSLLNCFVSLRSSGRLPLLGRFSDYSKNIHCLPWNSPNFNMNIFNGPLNLCLSIQRHEIVSVRWKMRSKDKPVDWLPFPWDWPPRFNIFNNSGDHVKINEIDSSLPKPMFESSIELKEADGNVKQIFSASSATIKERAEFKKQEILKNIQHHPLDFNSDEVKIVMMTIKIRKLFELWSSNKKNSFIKVALMNLIQKRNKLLKNLYRTDVKRFNCLIQVLLVEYKPQEMGVKKERFTKKWDLRRLTRTYCVGMRNSRRAAFHEELKAQQQEFVNEKIKTLTWISEEVENIKNSERA